MSVKGFKLSDGTVVKYDYSSLDNIITDPTLSVDGVAADAGAVGGLKQDLGDISNLETNDKSSIVNAINEIFDGGGSGGNDVQIYASGEDLIINAIFVDGNEVSY